MAEPLIFSDLKLTGRMGAPDPKQPRLSIEYDADFSGVADLTLEFTSVNQNGVFGVPRSLFVDNGSNPKEVEVTVSGTNQFFTIPAYAQGYFHLEAALSSSIRFETDGGATDKVTIIVFNWEVPPSVWYRFGTFNFDVPLMAQGSQPTGTDMDDPTAYNRPLLIAGVTAAGVLTRLLTDAAGAIISGGGEVFGPDAAGALPTEPPLYVGVRDSAGNIIGLQLNATGELPVAVATAAPVVTDYSIANMTGASEDVVAAGDGESLIYLQAPSANVGTIWINLAGGVAVVGVGVPIEPGGITTIQPGIANLVTGIAATANDNLTVYAG